MSDLNRLIATAGGYQPPAFDYTTNKRNMLAAQGQKLQNQLLQQQVETQPYRIALEQKAMEVERAALSVKEQALKLAQQGKRDVEIPATFDGKQYILSGDSVAISEVMGDTAGYAGQALDEQTGKLSNEWGKYLADRGISAKEVEPKAPIPGSEEWKEAERFKAGLTAASADKAIKTWVTPDNQIIHLPNNVTPPKGSVPYQTGIEFESTPEGGVSFSTVALPGKKTKPRMIPAEETSKIGEFAAYQKTMGDIESMIKTGDIDTGPFEFIREKVDNWGIATDEERVKLRSLVARLPGLMYAMRGKQLSDKELEVALKMMPKMNTTEKVFVNDTTMFAKYMSIILQGKKEAFEGGGYNVGAFNETNIPKPSLDDFWE